MSWDIVVQDLPGDAMSVADIPGDFNPAPIGKRSDVITRIKEVIPQANFSDPSWGLIDGDDWSIEVNIGTEEICNGFTFHVRGGNEAVGVIAAVLQHLNLRAIDMQNAEFFTAGPEAMESFRKWREYRDRVVKDHDG